MSAETPDPLLVRDLDESLYNLDAEETAFYKAQTRISDDDALRHHIVAVQRDAYAVHPYPCIHRFAFTQ
jgi:SHS2 domain-containing protein